MADDRVTGGAEGSRVAYLYAIVGLAARRVTHRAGSRGGRQTLLSVLGIGLAVGLMLLVASVSLGLAAQGTVGATGTDYWVLPPEGQTSVVADVGGTQFGQVHPATARLAAREDITYVTPVLVTTVRMQADSGKPARVLLVGIIPPPDGNAVMGVPTTVMTPGDPHYANGSYDGQWTGQAVLSRSAATAINASEGDPLRPVRTTKAANRTFTVTAVQPAQAPGLAQLPVVLVHLSELQTLTGAAVGDRADRLLIDASAPSAQAAAARVYPDARVVDRQGVLTGEASGTQLPVALGLAASLVAVAVGVLTVVTTVGIEQAGEAPQRAVLAALGIAGRTRFLLVGCETLVTAVFGGLVGIGLWLAGLGVLAVLGRAGVTVPATVVRLELGIYGMAVAVVVGVVSLPVVILLSRGGSLTSALPDR